MGPQGWEECEGSLDQVRQCDRARVRARLTAGTWCAIHSPTPTPFIHPYIVVSVCSDIRSGTSEKSHPSLTGGHDPGSDPWKVGEERE